MSKQSTKLAIRIESTTGLLESIEQTVAAQSLEFCDVAGFGELARAELSGPGGAPSRWYTGPFQLVSLAGRVRSVGGQAVSDFVCTLARQTDNGLELLGGKLLSAEAIYAEVTFESLELVDGVKAGQALSDRPAVAAPVAAAPQLDSRWAAAVEASQTVERQAQQGTATESARPKNGDVVNHQQFGRCTVAKVTDDHVTLRKPEGRMVQLGLSVLNFSVEGEEDGKRVLGVQVKTNR